MQERIRSAIQMILQNKGEDWFLVLEEPEHENFVQFTYDEGLGLIFDLPFQALSAIELEKARRLLGEFSIEPESSQSFDKPGGRQTGIQQSFNAKVGNDVELAVSLAYRIFTEVYGFDDAMLLNVTIMR